MKGAVSASVGSTLAALPWCCITPAALSTAGVMTAGIGSAMARATPLFVVLSAALLARALDLALVQRRGRPWVRVVTVVSAVLVVGLWSVRLGIATPWLGTPMP